MTNNDLHVLWRQYLDAADKLQTAMALLDHDNRIQLHLNQAMHAMLIGAEQCRQIHIRIGHD